MRSEARTIYTLGHGTRTIDELREILAAWGVRVLVDVRTVPRSRTNPQFNADVMAEAIAPVRYIPMKGLGGLRGRTKDAGDRNAGWENPSFRNYADYAQTPAFRAALDDLVALAHEEPCAILCAETVWWRCHRRIIADYLLARGEKVAHILSASKLEDATLTPFARPREDGTIDYRSSS